MADERLADLGKFLGDQRDRAQGTLRKLTDLAGVTAPASAAPPPAVDLATAIAHAPELTEEQRRTLAEIYASFRAANSATAAPTRAGDAASAAESAPPGAG